MILSRIDWKNTFDTVGSSKTVQQSPGAGKGTPDGMVSPSLTRRNETVPVPVRIQQNANSLSRSLPSTSATSEPAVKKKRRLNLKFSSVEMEEQCRAWRPSGNLGATVNGTPSVMISPNLARKNWTAPVPLPVRSQPNGTPQKRGAPGTSKSAESTASSSSHASTSKSNHQLTRMENEKKAKNNRTETMNLEYYTRASGKAINLVKFNTSFTFFDAKQP